jgi:hypothetical protein
VRLEFGPRGMELLLGVYDLMRRIERRIGLYLLLLGFWLGRRCCRCLKISRIYQASASGHERRAASRASKQKMKSEVDLLDNQSTL